MTDIDMRQLFSKQGRLKASKKRTRKTKDVLRVSSCLLPHYSQRLALVLVAAFLGVGSASAQVFPHLVELAQINGQEQPAGSSASSADATAEVKTGQHAPLVLTLQDALERAKANSPMLQAALTSSALAHEDARQARAGFLPAVTYNNQFLYTQGNGTPSGRFIANNAVHEYLSQANVHQVLALSQISEYRRFNALELVAHARAEIAARGLVATVVQAYYALVIAQRKYSTIRQSGFESGTFLKITQQLEQGGEVARSDVIKAQLQYQLGQQALRENQLATGRARAQLALLIFADFNQSFAVVDDLRFSPPLPSFAEVAQAASRANPDIRAAFANLKETDQEVKTAHAGYLPSLILDYFYGIDATTFATKTRRIPNLGYAAMATLNIPIFNWGITQSKIKQSNLKRQQARLDLTYAQRKLLADLRINYDEAVAARAQIELLRSSGNLAAESLRLTTLRYRAGEATVFEVTDAQNALIQARNGFDDGESRYRLALANLQTITGTF